MKRMAIASEHLKHMCRPSKSKEIVGSAWQTSEPSVRSVSVSSAICTFHSVLKLVPDFVHLLLCHHMVYRKSVALSNKAHYTKLDVCLFNNVFSAGISCECSYC